MTWTAIQTISPNKQWQFTTAVAGSYFRLKHVAAPTNPSAWICQAEQLSNGTYQIFDERPITVRNSIEIVELVNSGLLTNRCIGIKQKFPALATNPWSIAVEVSDFVEPESGNGQQPTDYSQQLNTITQQLTSIINDGVNSVQPNTDDHFADTVLLMHFDGANNATVFTDVKGKTFTHSGNAKTSTAQSRYGGSSCYFDGLGSSYLSTPDSNDWHLGNSDFMIELSVYVTGLNQYNTLLAHAGTSNRAWSLQVRSSGLVWYCTEDGSGADSSNKGCTWSYDFALNTWYDIAVFRFNSKLYAYVNNVLVGTNAFNINIFNSTERLYIGTFGNFGLNSHSHAGYIDELRIRKARVISPIIYNAPTTAFPDN